MRYPLLFSALIVGFGVARAAERPNLLWLVSEDNSAGWGYPSSASRT